jgi:hypothetical protein
VFHALPPIYKPDWKLYEYHSQMEVTIVAKRRGHGFSSRSIQANCTACTPGLWADAAEHHQGKHTCWNKFAAGSCATLTDPVRKTQTMKKKLLNTNINTTTPTKAARWPRLDRWRV